jgi:hypothetical protein
MLNTKVETTVGQVDLNDVMHAEGTLEILKETLEIHSSLARQLDVAQNYKLSIVHHEASVVTLKDINLLSDLLDVFTADYIVVSPVAD